MLQTPLGAAAATAKLNVTVASIAPPSRLGSDLVKAVLAQSGLNLDNLGVLFSLLAHYAAMSGETVPKPPKKHTFICCADHGVYDEGVSAYPQKTTVDMTRNYLVAKGAVANAMANYCQSEMSVIDLGIKADTSDIHGLVNARIANGTENAAKGPAMTRAQALKSVITGIMLVEEAITRGAKCILPGEMGISNTTASAAIAAAVCHLTPEEATGRGTNISDERLIHKIDTVRRMLEVNRPDANDGLDVLAKVGGFEIGAIVGIILGAAAHSAFVILDGFNTGAAALIAQLIAPLSAHYLLPSHLGGEKAHAAVLQHLGLVPYMKFDFRLGEATGSSIAAKFLDMVCSAFTAINTPDFYLDDVREKNYPASFAATMAKYEEKADVASIIEEIRQGIVPFSSSDMEECQYLLDNFTKPIYCCGRLETIAVNLAGLLKTERPPLGISRTLLSFTFAADDRSVAANSTLSCLTASFAREAGAKVHEITLDPRVSSKEAFSLGYAFAEKFAMSNCRLIGISHTEVSATTAFGETAKEIIAVLRTTKGHDFSLASLEALAPPLRVLSFALLGAIFGVSSGEAMVVLDDAATEAIAYLAEAVAPEIVPYILHVQPEHLPLNVLVPGGIVACLGFAVIDASLHMMNDMRTFAEAGVAAAENGPGAGRQKE